MINGWVSNETPGEYLNPIQCVETGLFALHWKRYSMAVEWLETGRQLNNESQFQKDGVIQDMSKDLIDTLIRVAIQEVFIIV